MRYKVQILLLILATLYAWRKGELSERVGAAIMVAMFLATAAYRWMISGPGRFDAPDLGFLVIDAATLLLMLGLALSSNRWWTLWMAASQLIAVLSHLVRMLDTGYAPFAYALMMRAPSWLELAILIVGTRLVHRRQQVCNGMALQPLL